MFFAQVIDALSSLLCVVASGSLGFCARVFCFAGCERVSARSWFFGFIWIEFPCFFVGGAPIFCSEDISTFCGSFSGDVIWLR